MDRKVLETGPCSSVTGPAIRARQTTLLLKQIAPNEHLSVLHITANSQNWASIPLPARLTGTRAGEKTFNFLWPSFDSRFQGNGWWQLAFEWISGCFGVRPGYREMKRQAFIDVCLRVSEFVTTMCLERITPDRNNLGWTHEQGVY